MMHLPDEIERVHLKHLAHEEPDFPPLDSLDKSGDEFVLADNSFALDGLRHLERHRVELDRLVAGYQELLRVLRGKLHVPIRSENPVVLRIYIGRSAMLHLRHQFGDGLGKPTDCVVDAELIGTVSIDLATTSTVEQKFARLARLADPR